MGHRDLLFWSQSHKKKKKKRKTKFSQDLTVLIRPSLVVQSTSLPLIVQSIETEGARDSSKYTYQVWRWTWSWIIRKKETIVINREECRSCNWQVVGQQSMSWKRENLLSSQDDNWVSRMVTKIFGFCSERDLQITIVKTRLIWERCKGPTSTEVSEREFTRVNGTHFGMSRQLTLKGSAEVDAEGDPRYRWNHGRKWKGLSW